MPSSNWGSWNLLNSEPVVIVSLTKACLVKPFSQRPEMAYTNAAIAAVVGGLSLWRGFDSDDKDEVEVKKTK